MRNFGEADKKKKQMRIKIPENPAGLSDEVLSSLVDAVKAALREGNLPCGAAFKIARDAGVPRIAVGEITDRLGIRITNCQIGCFKVDKTVHGNLSHKEMDGEILAMLETLKEDSGLTCAAVFKLAQQLKSTPMAVADVANIRSLRIHNCQLGCF